jgi:hypothetical protein
METTYEIQSNISSYEVFSFLGNLHESLKEIIHRFVSKPTDFFNLIKDLIINIIYMSINKNLHALFPSMYRFHWKCPKLSLNLPFKFNCPEKY